MLVKDFDYKLPKELIAQYPPEHRGQSKLLVLHRKTKEIEHRKFYNIIDYFNSKDVLVLNETKVIPARLIGKRVGTGGKVEIFLLNKIKSNPPWLGETGEWEVLISPGRANKLGVRISFGPDFWGEVKNTEAKHPVFKFHYNGNFESLLYKYGQIPLPPYIKRAPVSSDYKRYQTTYAKSPGACAAPTAGLHFTKEILNSIKEKGIEIAKIVVHTGFGSFKPIKCERVENHNMEVEYYKIPDKSANKINKAKRVIAVGTSAVRALETQAKNPIRQTASGRKLKSVSGWTDKFIYPPYKFKIVGALITNFHLPKSTLFLLVCAFAGKELIYHAYQEAIKSGYKFYSYGDAMLII
ncbi:tRNA preQ1(34) S-adenosylmethionine ribosyltransferase-isomerase QueA [candidate division WOR-3 bacterium]|nr:tRNA preQ1(34) S-adenosylmethionine ribosyltransferase-isomerase QueA [candidate division WOR-3 bacterium]